MQWLQDYIEVTARRQKEPIPGQNPVQHSNTGLNRGSWWRPVAMETPDLYLCLYKRAGAQSASQWVGQWMRGRKLASLAGWPARLESNTLTHCTFARHTHCIAG